MNERTERCVDVFPSVQIYTEDNDVQWTSILLTDNMYQCMTWKSCVFSCDVKVCWLRVQNCLNYVLLHIFCSILHRLSRIVEIATFV